MASLFVKSLRGMGKYNNISQRMEIGRCKRGDLSNTFHMNSKSTFKLNNLTNQNSLNSLKNTRYYTTVEGVVESSTERRLPMSQNQGNKDSAPLTPTTSTSQTSEENDMKEAKPKSGKASQGKPVSLEIKDPSIIFNTVWMKLEEKYGRENLRFPKEIIWLMGAPGSGKSFNTPWILKARGLDAHEIVMSSLLTSPEAEKIKKEAGLVGDSTVVEILFERLIQSQYSNGVLVDGFPRTKVQVDVIKMLHDKMKEMRSEFIDTDLAIYFRRPVFRVAVLFVDEAEAVARQLKRGREAKEHNNKVRDTGMGELKEERTTDFDPELAKTRYGVFKSHYSTLQELQKNFPFSVINTRATIDEVRNNIMREFMYQSSLELSEETFDMVQKIPLVLEISQHARQNLVRRLDNYQMQNVHLFAEVIDIIQKQFIPVMEKHMISGNAQIRIQNPIFEGENSLALQMALDVLSERGYYANSHQIVHFVPKKFDLKTGEIQSKKVITYIFNVTFKRISIRSED